MPTITPSDALSGGARGMGMQLRLDENALRTLSMLRPGDTFQVDYTLDIEGAGCMKARLQVALTDPDGLFAGHTIMAVLGQLLTQIVEHRLS